jgi:hypothetical protein
MIGPNGQRRGAARWGFVDVEQPSEPAYRSRSRSRSCAAALQGCLDDLQGICEELRDSVGALEEMGGPAGRGTVARTLGHLARAAEAISQQRRQQQQRDDYSGPGTTATRTAAAAWGDSNR